jgi:hypothetical protein
MAARCKVLTAQAKALGTVGGPKALGDMFAHLQGEVSGLGGDVAKTTALLAGFGGNKGFTPQQRERALGGITSRVEGNAEGFERFLGHSITDEYGHIPDMTGVLKELADYGGNGAGQRKRLEFTFGKEATAALMHTDFGAIRAQEKATPAGDMQESLDRQGIGGGRAARE